MTARLIKIIRDPDGAVLWINTAHIIRITTDPNGDAHVYLSDGESFRVREAADGIARDVNGFQ